jgi:hypothetical protein
MLDRQGSFQFWNGVWDSKINFSTFFINFFFLNKLISCFIRGKNSANYYFLIKNSDFEIFLEKNNLIFNENFSFLTNFFQQKKSFKFFFFIFGRINFFKFQKWCVIYISIYRPLNKNKIKKIKQSIKHLFFFFEKKKQLCDFF